MLPYLIAGAIGFGIGKLFEKGGETFMAGGRITTNEDVLNSFLTSTKEVKVNNLSTHFNEYENLLLLRNYYTLIATRKGNDVKITNVKHSKTTSAITNRLKALAEEMGYNVSYVSKFDNGGETFMAGGRAGKNYYWITMDRNKIDEYIGYASRMYGMFEGQIYTQAPNKVAFDSQNDMFAFTSMIDNHNNDNDFQEGDEGYIHYEELFNGEPRPNIFDRIIGGKYTGGGEIKLKIKNVDSFDKHYDEVGFTKKELSLPKQDSNKVWFTTTNDKSIAEQLISDGLVEKYAGGGKAGKYSIIVWETEEDRDAGESFVAEILTNKQEALEKAEKMYYKQDFSAIEVIDENDEVILHLSSNEEDEDEYAGGGKLGAISKTKIEITENEEGHKIATRTLVKENKDGEKITYELKVGVFKDRKKGYFEIYATDEEDEEYFYAEGGLWIEGGRVVDYDGVYELSEKVRPLLSALNLNSQDIYAKGGEAGKTSNLSSVKRKYLKNENENAHSENVVLLAENFGDSEDLKLAKEILKLHNKEGHLSTQNGKKRQELHLKLIKIARKKFGQEGIEFANGGGVEGMGVDFEKVKKADEIYREHNRERISKGIENFSEESVELWNKKYDDRLNKLNLTYEEKSQLNPKNWYAGGGKITDADLNYYIYPNKIVKIAYLGKIQMGYFFSLKDALKEIEYLTMAYPKNEIEKYAIITPDKTFHLGEKEYNIRFDNGGGVGDDLFSMSKTIIENGKITEMVIAENVSVNEFNKLFSDKGYEKRNDETLVGFYFMKPNGDTIQLIPSFHKKGEILKYAGGGGVGSKTLTRKYLQNKGRNVFTFGYGMPKDAIDKYGTIGGTEYFELPNGDVYKKSKEDSDKFVLIGNKSKMSNGGGVEYRIGGEVDKELTIEQTRKIAQETANSLGTEFSVTKNSVDVASFDLDLNGEEFEGGSYLIMKNGDVLNVALPNNPVYYNYKERSKNPKMIRTIFEEEYFEDFDNGGEAVMIYLISDNATPKREISISENDILRESKNFFNWRNVSVKRIKSLGSTDYDKFIEFLYKKGYGKEEYAEGGLAKKRRRTQRQR